LRPLEPACAQLNLRLKRQREARCLPSLRARGQAGVGVDAAVGVRECRFFFRFCCGRMLFCGGVRGLGVGVFIGWFYFEIFFFAVAGGEG
jgi:hypothetical protein